MKKLMLTVATATFLVGPLGAAAGQEEAAPRVSVLVGVASTTLSGDVGLVLPEAAGGALRASWSSETAFSGGLRWLAADWGNLAFVPEVLVARRKAELDLAIPTLALEGGATYLEVPLLLRWSPGSSSGPRFAVRFGPTVALRLDSSVAVKVDGTEVDAELDDDIRDFDVALTGAVGVLFGPRNRLSLDLRYDLGLSSVFSNNNPQRDADSRWRSIRLLFGFGF